MALATPKLDYQKILERIRDIVSGNGAVVEIGRYPEITHATDYPAIFVDSGTPYRAATDVGRVSPDDVQFSVMPTVTILVNSADPITTKKELIALTDVIRDALLKNPTLTSSGTDPLAKRGFVIDITEDASLTGGPIQASVIRLKYQIGSQLELSMPSVGRRTILSIPIVQNGVDYIPQHDTMVELTGYSPTGEFHKRTYEFEAIESTEAKLLSLMNSKEIFTIAEHHVDFITGNASQKTLRGMLENYHIGMRYDGLLVATVRFVMV